MSDATSEHDRREDTKPATSEEQKFNGPREEERKPTRPTRQRKQAKIVASPNPPTTGRTKPSDRRTTEESMRGDPVPGEQANLSESELRLRTLESELGAVKAQLSVQREMCRNMERRMEAQFQIIMEAVDDLRSEQQIAHTAGCLNILIQMCGALLDCRIPECNSPDLTRWDAKNYEKFARIQEFCSTVPKEYIGEIKLLCRNGYPYGIRILELHPAVEQLIIPFTKSLRIEKYEGFEDEYRVTDLRILRVNFDSKRRQLIKLGDKLEDDLAKLQSGNMKEFMAIRQHLRDLNADFETKRVKRPRGDANQ